MSIVHEEDDQVLVPMQTHDISRTSGVTIQHGVDVDDVQRSSENAKTPWLQLAQEISIAAYEDECK